MKIVSRPDEKWEHRFTCNQCQAVLEADVNDLRKLYNPGDQRDQIEGGWRFFVVCVVCSDREYIPAKVLNYAIQQKARNDEPDPYGR